MKKIAAICCLFSVVSLSYAQTCPAPKDIFFKRDGKIIVVAPPGWRVAADERQTSAMLSFSVGAWGDHVHNTDPVRCHYFNGQDHVRLDTVSMLTESAFTSHSEWGRSGAGDYYFLCTGVDVKACPFG